jgi:hypothetical protein
MGKIGYWSRNERLGDDTWINTSSNAYYQQIDVLKHPTKKEFSVRVINKDRIYFAMGKNSGTSEWYGMTYTYAMSIARKIMRANPNG